MPNYFVTFRAHSAEPDVFEDWMILLSKIFEKQQSLAWQIEWDETPSRHVHLLLFNKVDNSKVSQLFNNKAEKQFKLYLKNKLTIWDGDEDNCPFCKVIRCDDKDPLKSTDYYIGYIYKHSCSRGGQTDDITSEYIARCVDYYYTMKKLSKKQELNNSIKLVTNKNAYSHLISFVNKPENETSFGDRYLKYKAVKFGNLGFGGITDNAESKIFQELRIMNNQEWDDDKQDCNQKSLTSKDKVDKHYHYDKMSQNAQEISFLLDILEKKNVQLTPQEQFQIKNIRYNIS